MIPSWETIKTSDKNATLRRIEVESGWLYQVESIERRTADLADTSDVTAHGWSPPVFVPATGVMK